MRAHLGEHVDGSSLAFFRVVFATIVSLSAVRFLANGWVERFFVQPEFFFPYRGAEWARVLSSEGMTALFVVQAVSGALIGWSRTSRVASAVFFAAFTYVELVDVTNYLNHYYLVSLLSLLLAAVPTGPTIPRWAVWILRFQVGVVYTFAALAKATPDWLVHAQPMNIWMSARTETWLIGPLLGSWWVALLMGWAGFLNDLLAPWLLSWRRTRVPMYLVILVFHVFTAVFFEIGIFPFLMVGCATLFFEPGWVRAVRARLGARAPSTPDGLRTGLKPRPAPALLIALLGLYAFVQVAVPARWLVYGGDVNWHEQGMRWAWKVMCREKNGSVTYHVTESDGREQLVFPTQILTDHQAREFSGQPDMIVQLGQYIGRNAGPGAEVRVEALVSLNGRRAEPLIDTTVDLMTIDLGVGRAEWILPAPSGLPVRIER